MSDIAGQTHNLINSERRKRKLPHVFWSREMYHYAKQQAGYCARVGKLVHSHRYAFQGGENLWGGKGDFQVSPRSIVDSWLHSKAGHREYLLSSRVTKAAVAIVKSKSGAYAAWAFSDESPSYPDCPFYKTKRHSPMHKSKGYTPRNRKTTIASILMILGGCMGVGGGLAILFLDTMTLYWSKLLAELPGIYDFLVSFIINASLTTLSESTYGFFHWLGLIPIIFGIVAFVGSRQAYRRRNWHFSLWSSILTIPIAIPLGIASTIILAYSRREFKY